MAWCVLCASAALTAAGAPTRLFAITAVTSSQGRGVLDTLLNAAVTSARDHTKRYLNIRIRALVRNASAPTAAQLGALDGASGFVEVVECDTSSRQSVDAALSEVTDMVIITFSDFSGANAEEAQVTTLAAAASAAGVARLVFSSGDNIGVPALSAKYRLESVLAESDVPALLFLRTAFFLESFVAKGGEGRVKRADNATSAACTTPEGDVDDTCGSASSNDAAYVFSLALEPHRPIPVISSYDVGVAAAAALLDPTLSLLKPGRPTVVLLAGDVVSPIDFADAFTVVTGKRAAYREAPLDDLNARAAQGDATAAAIAAMYEWYRLGHPGHERSPAKLVRRVAWDGGARRGDGDYSRDGELEEVGDGCTVLSGSTESCRESARKARGREDTYVDHEGSPRRLSQWMATEGAALILAADEGRLY